MRTLTILLCALSAAGIAQPNLVNVNGAKLFVITEGSGEPIVLLHGGPGLNHSYFRPHLSMLEQQFKLVYFDQRASGRSPIPSPDSISMHLFVEDLEALRQMLQLDKMNLLAHSWGAILAVHYAQRYPDRINKMILSNPAMMSREFDKEIVAMAKQRTTAADSAMRAQLIASPNNGVKKYEDLLRLSFKLSAYDAKNLERLNLNLQPDFQQASKALFSGLGKDPAQQADLYPVLAGFTFPVLIVVGKADIVPTAALERLQRSIPAAEVQIFERSGHFPFVEETEKFNRTIHDFVKKEKVIKPKR